MAYMYTDQSCAEHLSGAVQFATLSNDKEELIDFDVFFQLHDYLEKTYPHVHAVMEKEVIGKAALLYRWKGTGKSNARPLMFMAHLDVVPEGDHSKWTYPPYSGTIADGCVWGRGASDCKTKMISQLEALEHLISTGFQPDFDVYLAYGYNEEVSGGNSISAAKLIANTLAERGIRIGCALDEGGGLKRGSDYGVDVPVCALSVGEKGYADFKIARYDRGGHSMFPRKDGALYFVADAIRAIRDNQFPYRITPAVKARLEALAPLLTEKDPKRAELYSDIESHWDELQPIIDADPALAAMCHTTMIPTMAQGSSQSNILPEEAYVIVNSRILQGDTIESVRKHIESIIPEGMEVTLMKGNDPSPVSSSDTDIARLILEVCRYNHGDDVVFMPDLTMGGTDAKHMYGVCDYVYRFDSVYRVEGEHNAHAVNENMDIKVLGKSPSFYVELIKRYGK